MAEERQVLHSGGCQCGAVRYALYAEPYGTHTPPGNADPSRTPTAASAATFPERPALRTTQMTTSTT